MKLQCPLMDNEIKGFKCGNASIEAQIEDSYYITLLKQAYGYKIVIDGIQVGYYMLYFKEIKLDTINSIMGDDYLTNMVEYYTAVHIRYIAIDERVQNQGIGTIVFKGILNELIKLSEKYPIRIITLDALAKYYDWYKKIGFKDIPGKESDGITYPMYMDCMTKKDADKLDEFQRSLC